MRQIANSASWDLRVGKIRKAIARRIASTGLGREVDADDVVNEAVARLCKTPEKKPITAVTAYLIKAGHRILIDCCRKRHRSGRAAQSLEVLSEQCDGSPRMESPPRGRALDRPIHMDDVADDRPTPASEFMTTELWEHVGRLPDREREVMELIYQNGYKVKEIAKRWEVTPNVVYGLKARGLIRLREMVSKP